MRALALVLALAGCASAGNGEATIDGNGGGSGSGSGSGGGSGEINDAPMAPPIDSGPTTRTLSQTTTNNLKALGSIACANQTSGTTRANNYYRVFDLAAAGITTAFTVSQVSFQIEHCQPGTTVAVRVGTYSGTPGATLTPANIAILASNPNVAVQQVVENTTPPASTPGGTVNAPITATIPAGQKLLVEVDAADGNNVYSFYMGANDGGESAPGYVMAPTCNINTPTSITQAAGAPVHLLLTVTGQY